MVYVTSYTWDARLHLRNVRAIWVPIQKRNCVRQAIWQHNLLIKMFKKKKEKKKHNRLTNENKLCLKNRNGLLIEEKRFGLLVLLSAVVLQISSVFFLFLKQTLYSFYFYLFYLCVWRQTICPFQKKRIDLEIKIKWISCSRSHILLF